MGEGFNPDELERILRRAEAASGIDFVRYRPSTMQRRTELRMAMCECTTADDYLRRLDHDRAELDALVDALLVKTTWMYREPRTFDLLRGGALASLVAARRSEGASMIRAWVPACSTGEEAYTLAMCIDEVARELDPELELQVFATDVDERALKTAADGVYGESVCSSLPGELRSHYTVAFMRGEGRYTRVVDDLRSRIFFSRHDALRSPHIAPKNAGVASFDLVCCRNLLVYLQNAAQDELMQRLLKTCSRGSLFVIGDSEGLRATLEHEQLAPIQVKIPVFRVK